MGVYQYTLKLFMHPDKIPRNCMPTFVDYAALVQSVAPVSQ